MMKNFCRATAIAALALTGGVAFAGEAPGYALLVTAGLPDPNGILPNFNHVPDAGVGNLDIAIPVAILEHGQSYDILLESQNGSYHGTCIDSYKLVQEKAGKAVTLLSGTISKYSCAVGTQWGYYIGSKPIPDSPGAATLIGTVKYGTKSVSVSVPVYIK